MLLTACGANTSGSDATDKAAAAKDSLRPSEFCALLPITVGEGDAFTDTTAEQILAVNLFSERVCP